MLLPQSALLVSLPWLLLLLGWLLDKLRVQVDADFGCIHRVMIINTTKPTQQHPASAPWRWLAKTATAVTAAA